MNINNDTVLKELVTKFGDRYWFSSVGMEKEFGRSAVLYVKEMSRDILKEVPEKVSNLPILLHFAAHKEIALPKPIVLSVAPIDKEEEEESSIDIISELFILKRICGGAILANILNEIHLKGDTKTNDSKDFPEVKNKLTELYSDLGYDVLYEEISL